MKPKKLEAPTYGVKFTVNNGTLYCDFSRTEYTKDSMFFRLERQSFAVPKRLIAKILKAK